MLLSFFLERKKENARGPTRHSMARGQWDEIKPRSWGQEVGRGFRTKIDSVRQFVRVSLTAIGSFSPMAGTQAAAATSTAKPGMRKPVFTKIDQLKPGTAGHTLTVKVLTSTTVLNKGRAPASGLRQTRIAECLVGDETGCILFTARNEQGFVFFSFSSFPFFSPDVFLGFVKFLVMAVVDVKLQSFCWLERLLFCNVVCGCKMFDIDDAVVFCVI